jgi:hypothetical protein
MNKPTAKEIDPYDSLDGRVACKNFLGKNLEEAEALFRDNSVRYQEDLMWMGPIAFRYYVTSAICYIQSEAAAGDSDMINCIAGLLEFRLEHETTQLVPIARQLADVCAYVVEHFERFDLDPEIYGDVRTRCQTLQEAFLRMAEQANNKGGA